MRSLRILTSDGRLVAGRAKVALSVFERMKGWLGKTAVAPDEALLLPGTSSVHSWGMHFSFDLVFVDRAGEVVKLCPRMAPYSVAYGPFKAWAGMRGLQALELPEGSLERLGLQLGERLVFEDRTDGGDV
jgi:uncharacterized membrane protein (UPF0127 family)